MSGRVLRESLANSVKELYSAEQQQARLLPKLVDAASSKALQRALALHLQQTAHQAARLERVFTLLGEPIRWARCPGVIGILEECDEAIEEHRDGALRDAAIIATAQRLDYYEMAAYGAAAAWAQALGLKRVATLLNRSLDEEVAIADELLAVALTRVHARAARVRMQSSQPRPTDPVLPHGPIPDLPRSPEQPVVPPDDGHRDDVVREPTLDPPGAEPPVQAPSERPLIEEPPRPRA
jgi:ferritin-like metal-binding protein YciE